MDNNIEARGQVQPVPSKRQFLRLLGMAGGAGLVAFIEACNNPTSVATLRPPAEEAGQDVPPNVEIDDALEFNVADLGYPERLKTAAESQWPGVFQEVAAYAPRPSDQSVLFSMTDKAGVRNFGIGQIENGGNMDVTVFDINSPSAVAREVETEDGKFLETITLKLVYDSRIGLSTAADASEENRVSIFMPILALVRLPDGTAVAHLDLSREMQFAIGGEEGQRGILPSAAISPEDGIMPVMYVGNGEVQVTAQPPTPMAPPEEETRPPIDPATPEVVTVPEWAQVEVEAKGLASLIDQEGLVWSEEADGFVKVDSDGNKTHILVFETSELLLITDLPNGSSEILVGMEATNAELEFWQANVNVLGRRLKGENIFTDFGEELISEAWAELQQQFNLGDRELLMLFGIGPGLETFDPTKIDRSFNILDDADYVPVYRLNSSPELPWPLAFRTGTQGDRLVLHIMSFSGESDAQRTQARNILMSLFFTAKGLETGRPLTYDEVFDLVRTAASFADKFLVTVPRTQLIVR